MAKEVEYKFICRDVPETIKRHKPATIWQGYIFISPEKQVRVRLWANDSLSPEYKKAWMCVKFHEGNTRDEFEVEMDFEEASKLYSLCKYKLTKNRYSYRIGDVQIDYDVYPDGDKIVEIELSDSKSEWDDKIRMGKLPKWILDSVGANVDGQWKYNNYCKAGFPEEQYK